MRRQGYNTRETYDSTEATYVGSESTEPLEIVAAYRALAINTKREIGVVDDLLDETSSLKVSVLQAKISPVCTVCVDTAMVHQQYAWTAIIASNCFVFRSDLPGEEFVRLSPYNWLSTNVIYCIFVLHMDLRDISPLSSFITDETRPAASGTRTKSGTRSSKSAMVKAQDVSISDL